MSRQFIGYGLGLIGITIFGATLPLTRIAVESFNPWFLTFGRGGIAGLLAICVLVLARRPWPKGQWVALCIASAAVVIGFPGFAGLAMLTVPASHGGVVLGALPIATACAAVLVAGERPSPAFWFFSLSGAAAVTLFSLRDADGAFVSGDLWLALATITVGIGYAYLGRISRTMPGWEAICWALVIALPVTIPATALLWRPVYLDAPTGHWFAFAYLAVFSVFLGFFAWNAALAIGGVAKVGQVQLLQTFVTLAISALLLKERISPEMFLFAVGIAFIVVLTSRTRVGMKGAPAAQASGGD